MIRSLLAFAVVFGIGAASAPPMGTKYRFREDTLVGTVWVLGNNARRELEAGEDGIADGRVEIWKDGGKQIFVLNPKDRTYYDRNVFRINPNIRDVSTMPFTVSMPFRVEGVENVKVDLAPAERTSEMAGYRCQAATLRFSYTLKVLLQMDNSRMPAAVAGETDFCVMNRAPAMLELRLPFGHGLEVKTGQPAVDAEIASRLAGLTGIPLVRITRVTRRIQTGEAVSKTSGVLLSDFSDAPIPPDRFEIPKDYRFQEPVIVGPVRR